MKPFARFLALVALLAAPVARADDPLAAVAVPRAVHVAVGARVQLIAALTNPSTEILYLRGASYSTDTTFVGNVSVTEFLRSAPDSLLPSESWEGVVGAVTMPAGAPALAAQRLDVVLMGGAHPHDQQVLTQLSYSVDDSAAVLGAPHDPPSALRLEFSATPNPSRGPMDLMWTQPVQGRVDLRVLDLNGRTVRVLLSEDRAAGVHRASWDGLRASGIRVPAGVYFLRLHTGDGARRLKVVRLD